MQQTVLNAVHRDLGARLVEFGGYEMPVWYSSLTEEHHTVRRAAGLFDLCHMGRFEIMGAAAIDAVDHVITNHVARMKPGQITDTPTPCGRRRPRSASPYARTAALLAL